LVKEAVKGRAKAVPDEDEEGEGEGDDNQPDEEEEEGEGDEKPERIIFVGRLFKKEGSWMYEKFNYAYYESEYPDLLSKVGEIEKATRTYSEDTYKQIEEEKENIKLQAEREAEKMAQRMQPKKSGKRKSRK